ncbi:conserved hypothetical protein [Leishmania infantum JPCM5]|uniref:SSU_ribosomal_protein_-_mitochondrial_-_putative n=2 Tax=Leishmania infantum TaxID=5671 RepID=A0A6L0XE05_LEIIN|nr:conserved hypothetical protein [Leishmania infantum JPCM5]CAC9484270.1 SSU_ribosomal_protein_-_mitochondrial_-_putative [Leishmania infantum]CAM67448.1 conserved hypothetical protein [Leishmania infantum JPCM5]SUZ41334.1 SSU_ribosomal_protein_-_mitochondrial_-_putative [Leishmania infantum]|eukprot:XP_001465201.1 conserved hypothetical protein [Leishmania infantum JPCM5]
MVSYTSALLRVFNRKNKAPQRMSNFTKVTNLNKAEKVKIETVDGDVVKGRGRVHRRSHSGLKDAIEEMEHPAIWLWYPWRKNPEPPTPYMPSQRALKNIHGAIFTNLSPIQKKKQEQMLYGVNIPETRVMRFEQQHPLLSTALKQLDGQPKGFPFWYKKYPTRRHAYEQRFSVPTEMLEGYNDSIKKAFSMSMMTIQEKQFAQEAMYMERYAEHDFDTTSPAVLAVKRALKVRVLRNHLLTNPHNNIVKTILANTERKLNHTLRRLRKVDFKRYWEIIRDHDVQDVLQPPNLVTYRQGSYWRYDWNAGLAISTQLADVLDPRGLNGCVETGRSRSEVARDLGLSYTRPLQENEKKQLSEQAVYYERLAKFKMEQPEAARAQERERFVRKFSGMFLKMDMKSGVPDFPSTYRKLLGTQVARWSSKRHGPM